LRGIHMSGIIHMYSGNLPLKETRMNYPSTFQLPTSDTLTGLLTAPYFRHLLREELLPQAEKSGDPLSLFLGDIDDFVGVNITYGHDVASQVLNAVGTLLREACPESAVLSRYGGDELAVALPDTRLDDAFTLAEKVRRGIVGLRFDQHPEIQISFSIGLASYPSHGRNDVELMREADQALYTAKATGRNKVALPLADSRMITKTSHYTATQLERLAQLAKTVKRNEASLLREALDDLFKKHDDRLEAVPRES
jgi:diguanylate cyclase (GGDEF)-like protein